ncbi:hypothetical protein ACHAPT_001299 [Fusarium lateritium]
MRFPLLLLAATVVGQVVPDYNTDICFSIKKTTTVEMVEPLSEAYQEERMNYLWTAARSKTPSCVLYPDGADHVRGIMIIISQSDKKFAVKAGGSNPNPGFSSVDFGPLISLKKMNHVVLDPSTGQVDLGPGAIWKDVIAKLDGTGWSLPSPRFGEVGVGGYLVGGGLSFMSQQYGWGASSILEMQVVLANGTMAIASAANNADLYRAIKGGGNKYGIVTSFHMQARPQGIVWGGIMTFHRDTFTDRRIATALRDFTQHNTDPKASIMLRARRIHEEKLDVWVVFAFYDGRQSDWSDSAAMLFQNFLNLDPFKNTCRDRSYADLIKENDRLVPKDRISVIGTETIPNPPEVYGNDLLLGIYFHWREIVELIQILPGMIAEISFTPFNYRAAEAARDNGLDILDMEDKRRDRIIVEASFSWYGHSREDLKPMVKYNEMQARMSELMKNVTETTWDISQDMIEDGDIRGMYLPLHMNSAGAYQDFVGRLRITGQQFVRDMMADYDPNKVFKRTMGFTPWR